MQHTAFMHKSTHMFAFVWYPEMLFEDICRTYALGICFKEFEFRVDDGAQEEVHVLFVGDCKGVRTSQSGAKRTKDEGTYVLAPVVGNPVCPVVRPSSLLAFSAGSARMRSGISLLL